MANYLHRLLTLVSVIFVLTAGSSLAAAQTPQGGSDDEDQRTHPVDRADASIRGWMKAQAQYWRREEYSAISSLAGTKDYYRKAELIEAQRHLDYAKVALGIDQSEQEAFDELDKAMSLIKLAENGASQDELTQINQITMELDRIRGDIKQLPPLKERTEQSRQELTGVANALKRLVIAG
jgi:hypothetical protein